MRQVSRVQQDRSLRATNRVNRDTPLLNDLVVFGILPTKMVRKEAFGEKASSIRGQLAGNVLKK